MSEKIAGENSHGILIVDDTTANLQLLTNLLAEQGYTVYPASDGELALEFVRTTLPDLILLDIRMPGMDGYEVCRRLKADERTCSVPVIFISALEEERDKVRGFREGAVDYISKPFQPEEVLARIHTHLRLKELTERLEQKVAERTEALHRETEVRKRTEEEIRLLNQQLEQRVNDRTAELEAKNAELKREMDLRLGQQQFLEALLESTEAGIVACDADGILTLFNRRSRELHGLPQTPIPADQWAKHYDLFLADGKTVMRTEDVPLFRAFKGERVVNDEMMIIPRGGEAKTLLASGRPIFDHEGRKIGAVIAMHDITERKRAEEAIRTLNATLEERVVERTAQLNEAIASLNSEISERKRIEAELKESEARYRNSSNLLTSILESAANVSVYALDREYRYLAFNRRHWEGMNYLWGGDIAVGMSMLDAIGNDESRDVYRRGFDEVLTGRSFSMETKHVIVKDGRQVSEYFENHGFPIFNDDGNVVGLTLFSINITERKRIETELENERLLLKALLKTIPDPVWLKDPHGVFLLCNAAFARLYDTTEAALIGTTDYDYVPPELAAFFQRMDREAMAAGRTRINEEWVTFAGDGHNALWETIKTPLHDGRGGVVGVLGVARDITDRKRMEEQLRFSEQQFRSLAENLPGMIMRYDRECRRMYVNPAFVRETGIPAEMALGLSPEDIWMNDANVTAGEYTQVLRRVMATGAPAEMLLEWPNRETAHMSSHLVHIAAERGVNGEVNGCLAIDHDISRLRETELKLAKLTKTAPGMLFSVLMKTDGTFCMPYASHRMEEFFTIRLEDVAHDMAEAFSRIHPEDFPRVMGSIEESARALSHWHLEFRILHPVKGDVWVEGNSIPERQPDGGILWYGFLHDITERKRSEEALNIKRAEMAALSSELSMAEERERQNIAAMLHDHVGQTLLLVRIKLGILAKEITHESGKIVVEEAKTLLDQVTYDVHNMTVQMNPPILAALGLEAALEWLGRRMEEDYGLFVEFEDDLEEKPLLDEVRYVVYQCGRELLINVAKHADTDHARIVVAREDDRYRVTVEDDGVGFDPATLVPDASRDCGFGLFSIQIRMERMGGSVAFESAPGKGSRMTLLAPLAQKETRGKFT